MGTGAITQYVDVAQLVLYAFWIFFFGLIYWLQRESKREGYPMHSEHRGTVDGLLDMPAPKAFLLADGSAVYAPRDSDRASEDLPAAAPASFPGGPIEPLGSLSDAMRSGIGPGAWARRADVAEHMTNGAVLIAPLRMSPGFDLSHNDTDPRGLPVVGADGVIAGTVRDAWVDRAELLVRFLEVAIPNGARGPHVLLPFNFCRVGRDAVTVRSILGDQFADVPRTKNPDEVTLLEEEKIMAYYGAGTLYAEPGRQEALI